MNNNENMDALGDKTNSFIVSETQDPLGEDLDDVSSDYDEDNDVPLPYVFTRYLYPKDQVYHSLFLAILEKNVKEALFWGYELYYSGFQPETIHYVYTLFEEVFMSCNTDDFCAFIKKSYYSWVDDRERHDILGILIWNLVIRPYDVRQFLERYFEVKCKSISQTTCNNKKFIRINKFDPTPYATMELEKGMARTLMKQVCHYPIRSEFLVLFKGIAVKREDFNNHWLYFASGAPLWKERIACYNGYLNHEKKEVEFEDDDDSEEFYDLYGLDPDEQTLEIQQRCIGEKEQLSIVEFSKKYNGNMILKIKNNTKELARSRM